MSTSAPSSSTTRALPVAGSTHPEAPSAVSEVTVPRAPPARRASRRTSEGRLWFSLRLAASWNAVTRSAKWTTCTRRSSPSAACAADSHPPSSAGGMSFCTWTSGSSGAAAGGVIVAKPRAPVGPGIHHHRRAARPRESRSLSTAQWKRSRWRSTDGSASMSATAASAASIASRHLRMASIASVSAMPCPWPPVTKRRKSSSDTMPLPVESTHATSAVLTSSPSSPPESGSSIPSCRAPSCRSVAVRKFSPLDLNACSTVSADSASAAVFRMARSCIIERTPSLTAS
mmetsp:Transcript_27174/g.73370  ORF Transcript_27174/g.73370 Transcript_27174/m.73370 type:complete len:287 (-) Transcript_27174:2411-3271(-)